MKDLTSPESSVVVAAVELWEVDWETSAWHEPCCSTVVEITVAVEVGLIVAASAAVVLAVVVIVAVVEVIAAVVVVVVIVALGVW